MILNYTYVLHSFNLQRANELFQNHTSQLKVKIVQDVIERDICWNEKLSNYLKPSRSPLQLEDISAETAIFSYKTRKNKYGSYSNSYDYLSFSSGHL